MNQYLNSFTTKANEIHKSEYTYDRSVWAGYKNKIEITCKTHGSFWQTVAHHLRGQKCPKCVAEQRKLKLAEGSSVSAKNRTNKAKSEFVNKANEVHNNKYSYLIKTYVNSITKMLMVCPAHGVFEQTPANHLCGNGCPKCGHIATQERIKPMKSEISFMGGAKRNKEAKTSFVSKANAIHKNKFDYSLVNYVNSSTKVKIICPIHGVFEQTPSNHLKFGCRLCCESKGELAIAQWLEQHNIKYQREVSIKAFNKLKKFDFFLPELGWYIEYDGAQHFNPVKAWGGEEGLKRRQTIDKKREEWCKSNGVPLLVIAYNEDLESKLSLLL